MPVSSFRQPIEVGSLGPTYGKKKRKSRQRKRKLYQKIREDLQLSGDIPTAPEGAIRSEVVSPSVQSNQPLPELIAQAIKKGWAVEDGMKPHLVDELVGIVMSGDMPSKAKIAAFNALRMADETQWDRDRGIDKNENGPFMLNINVVAVDSNRPQPKSVEHQLVEVTTVVSGSKQDLESVREAATVLAE